MVLSFASEQHTLLLAGLNSKAFAVAIDQNASRAQSPRVEYLRSAIQRLRNLPTQRLQDIDDIAQELLTAQSQLKTRPDLRAVGASSDVFEWSYYANLAIAAYTSIIQLLLDQANLVQADIEYWKGIEASSIQRSAFLLQSRLPMNYLNVTHMLTNSIFFSYSISRSFTSSRQGSQCKIIGKCTQSCELYLAPFC